MIILAIDFGEKRFGLASADSKTEVALLLGEISFSSLTEAKKELSKIIKEKGASTLVFGLPLSFKFEETPICGKIRRFALEAEKEFGVKIAFVNEVLTTEMAKKLNQSTKNKDSTSAMIILQDYLTRLKEHGR
ncbi:MAG: Holliday junction resolvase RuvX [Patescibacteria group bacterium]